MCETKIGKIGGKRGFTISIYNRHAWVSVCALELCYKLSDVVVSINVLPSLIVVFVFGWRCAKKLLKRFTEIGLACIARLGSILT